MKKIVKIITFYDDGTFSESTPYVAPYNPSTPYGPLPKPYTPPTFPDNFTPYWETKKCPKCGIKLDGPMGYVCPNNPCPTGLGGSWCSTTGDCV